MITDFTTLSADDITSLLNATGYIGDAADTAKYISTDDGTVKYLISYENVDGETETAYVYVYIDIEGRLVAEY